MAKRIFSIKNKSAHTSAMEATISWDMDSVLLELQTGMFANDVIASPVNRSQPSSGWSFRLALTDKIKDLIDKANEASRRRKQKLSRSGRDEISLREIYYQNVGLFRNQNSVDNAVSKICRFLNLPQWDLGVLSTSKGLVYGPLIIRLKSGATIDCSVQQRGTLVPQDIPYGASYESNARFALVLEKDAAFQTLLSSELKGPLDRCILITGKGYPDMNTRFLVKEISTRLCLPTFVIVDGDPYGIDIFFTYKYGSLAKTYINGLLAAPSIFWLGIHPTDIAVYKPITVQPLTNNDVKKAEHLSKRSYVRRDDRLLEQIHEMINRGVKCEIENISTISNNYLNDVYIPTKISRKKFI